MNCHPPFPGGHLVVRRWFLWVLAVSALCVPAHASGTRVLFPDGSSAGGARAIPLVKTHFARIVDGAFEGLFDSEKPVTIPADGGLEVTQETAGRWVILHERGWADVVLAAETPEVRLQEWNSIAGKTSVPHTASGKVRFLRTERPRERNETGGGIFWTSQASVGEDGNFVISKVPSGSGTVGVLSEVKTDRRVSRWLDYPQAIHVPAESPVLLGGGNVVSGKIRAAWVPASVTLTPASPGPPYHGHSDETGRFAIPGILPGEYFLRARPESRKASRSLPARKIRVEDAPLDLGELPDNASDIEVDSRAELPEGLEGQVREIAGKHAASPIEQIWIGELGHPSGQFGARVTCEPVPDATDPTWATRQILLVKIPGEFIRKLYPESDLLGFGFRFQGDPSDEVHRIDSRVRVFPLKTMTLYVPLDEGTDYEDVLALLGAIESGKLIKPPSMEKKTAGGTTVFTSVLGLSCGPDILPLIHQIQKQSDGKIQISTHERAFGGKIFTFEKTDEGFILRGGGQWVA
ncbi:MAG: carboxypeptidase regulatory-like domain-containing protein [Chthoniobacterales bacterium]|nr:carboxypeptidase regulatory-like domain-containing protein [Chthoniobacterales bacterium]